MSTNFYSELDGYELLNDDAATEIFQCEGDKSTRRSNDIRLQDIEEQLENAESRCNNLKDQLDYMKQIYGVNRSMPSKTRKISNAKSPFVDFTVVKEDDANSHNDNRNIHSTNTLLNRQKSNHIGTDNTGAAVKTINNILNGITNSVNRLSEIHSQIATPRVKIANNISPRYDQKIMDQVAEHSKTSIGIVPELKIESTTSLLPKTGDHQRNGSKSSKSNSQHTIKRAMRAGKKVKCSATKLSTGLEKKSSTVIRNRILSRFGSKNNNLVEIYHNDAVKHSDSDESNLKKSRQQESPYADGTSEKPDVPPLNIHVLNSIKDSHQDQIIKSDLRHQNGYNNPFCCDPPQAPRTTVSCCYSKNYELPTVASRMKQVAKTYLGTLNLKTIPFCAAISTTQSHNIGINIQQVMNIIKNRQPINGISPTLAHNIGLAAEKLNSKPFSTLVSTINSRISQSASRCPLSRTYLNIQQLQEQAKNIPEDIIEEVDEETVESPQTQTLVITGPSGDMQVKTKCTPTWRLEKDLKSEECTCIFQPSMGVQNVANKYQRAIKTVPDNNINSQIIEHRLKKRLKRYKTTTNNCTKNTQVQGCPVPCTTIVTQEPNKDDTLNGREKNLKEVLTNLHNDFEILNRKYEDLSQKKQTDADENSIKELERLETELNKKEDEITMVMTLYKEVLGLKQQVKQLKEKRSHVNMPSKNIRDAKIQFKEYNNPEAAFHLTKLLKQIQHYQMKYRSNLSQE